MRNAFLARHDLGLGCGGNWRRTAWFFASIAPQASYGKRFGCYPGRYPGIIRRSISLPQTSNQKASLRDDIEDEEGHPVFLFIFRGASKNRFRGVER